MLGPQTPQTTRFWVCSGPTFPTFCPKSPGVGPDLFWGGFFGFLFPFREVFSFPEKTFARFLRFCFFSSRPKKAKKKAKGASGGTPGTPWGGVRPPVAPLLLAWGSITTETTPYHDREHHILVETPLFLLLDEGNSQSREKCDPHILTGTPLLR